MSEVVSVRIPREVKKALDEAGINASEEVRRHLEQVAWEARCRKSVEEMNKVIQERVKPSKKGFATRFVREDRDAHN